MSSPLIRGKPQELSPRWSNTDHLTNHAPVAAFKASCIFIGLFQSSNQRGWLVSGGGPRLPLLHESFMLFSSQLFGRIWLREVRGLGQMERPHGSSRCFAFVYAQLIKNNKPCHPRAAAIWETTRQRLPRVLRRITGSRFIGGGGGVNEKMNFRR